MSQAAQTMLREGIAAARAGNKPLTRQLLREVTRAEPRNEVAWLWLAGVAESPQEAVLHLERVLTLNPANERAREGLRATRLRAGMAECQAGNKPAARRWLLALTEEQPDNAQGWFWLAGVADTPQEAVAHLERALALNPDDLRVAQSIQSHRLSAGVAEYKAGRPEAARDYFAAAVEQDPHHVPALFWLAHLAEAPQDALAYIERVLELEPDNARAQQSAENYRRQLDMTLAGWQCGFCQAVAAAEPTICPECGALLSLDDLEPFFQPAHGINPRLLREAIQRDEAMLAESSDVTLAFQVGLAYLNLRQLDEALRYFQVAARFQPADHPLRGQVKALWQHKQALDAEARNRARTQEAPRTILVVDDSPTVRKLVTMTMEKQGFRVVDAADGQAAVERIRTGGVPDLILLDITMPGMDGYQVCRLIRQCPETQRVPVVMLSGKDGFFDKIRGRMAGSTEYITKPFKPEVVLQVVQKYVQPR
ncbi:MAG: response regulator [Planctomycetia bacterium]|nr:response regulator [Planctomycetia bacterium]